MTDPAAHTPSDSAGTPDIDALVETVKRRIAFIATDGTVVCRFCNASDVTDDGHRVGCPVLPILAALSDLAATAREPQSYREKRLVEKWNAAERRVAELESENEKLRASQRTGRAGRGRGWRVTGGTFSCSWGRYGGFYASLYPRTRLAPRTYARLCLGWVAFTYVPVEIDDLMRGYLDSKDAS